MEERVVLAVDVGGSHVKVLTSAEEKRRRFASGPELTPQQMVDGVLAAAGDWAWDVASVGIPSPVRDGKVVAEPVNLGDGWSASTSRLPSGSRQGSSTTR